MWLIFTGFLVAAYILQVPKGYNSENLILGLIYAWFTLYIISQYISFSRITRPVYNLGHSIMTPFLQLSKRWRLSIYALFVTTVIVATVFSFPETKSSTRKQRLISLFGLVVFLLLLTVSSHVCNMLCLSSTKILIYIYRDVKRSIGSLCAVDCYSSFCSPYSYFDHQLVMIYFSGCRISSRGSWVWHDTEWRS